MRDFVARNVDVTHDVQFICIQRDAGFEVFPFVSRKVSTDNVSYKCFRAFVDRPRAKVSRYPWRVEVLSTTGNDRVCVVPIPSKYQDASGIVRAVINFLSFRCRIVARNK
jgi:hypothetical protein